MDMNLETLKTYLAAYPLKYPLREFEYLLDSLFWEYLDGYYVSTDVIREQSRKAEEQMKTLTETQTDDVFNCFYLMCGEFQRLAFTAGAKVGATLALELMEKAEPE